MWSSDEEEPTGERVLASYGETSEHRERWPTILQPAKGGLALRWSHSAELLLSIQRHRA